MTIRLGWPLLSLEPRRSRLAARAHRPALRRHAGLQGLVDEVRRLRARGDLHAGLPSMRCVGYRQAWALRWSWAASCAWTRHVLREAALRWAAGWLEAGIAATPPAGQAPLHHATDLAVDFGGPIVQVFSTRAELAASHATWGVDIDGNLLADDYGSALAIGLEANDQLSWTPGQSLLSLAWTASHPGDHIRVLVGSVPEPTGLALALSALLALRASRRRDAGR
jgi:hypothetical protein